MEILVGIGHWQVGDEQRSLDEGTLEPKSLIFPSEQYIAADMWEQYSLTKFKQYSITKWCINWKEKRV